MQKTWDYLETIGLILIYGILMIGLPLATIVYIMPNIKSTLDEIAELRASVLTEDFYYTGTLGMVTYHNGWLGLGGISETALTFTDGKTFSFSGTLQVTVGQTYTVHYQVTTNGNNSTSTKIVSVIWKPQDEA